MGMKNNKFWSIKVTKTARSVDTVSMFNAVKRLVLFQKARKAMPTRKVASNNYHMRNALSYIASGIADCRSTIRNAQSIDSVETMVTVKYERGQLKIWERGSRHDYRLLKTLVRNRIKAYRLENRTPDSGFNHRIYISKLSHYAEHIGMVHSEPNYWLKVQKAIKARKVHESKKPATNDHHIGLELEFCSPAGRQELGILLSDAGLSDHVQLKGDGSIRIDRDGDSAHEICILAKQSEVHSIVPRVTAVLNAAGSYVNASCGYHVHLDMRNRDVSKCWHNLRQSQAFLYRMVPKTRKKNQYCKPVRTLNFSTARNSSNRYVGINATALRSHRTLEIRLHSSTLDPVKVLNWVDLLTGIIETAPLEKPVTTLLALRRAVPAISPSLANYIKRRVAMFESQHGEVVETPEVQTQTVARVPVIDDAPVYAAPNEWAQLTGVNDVVRAS
jgi:hypothetical protein